VKEAASRSSPAPLNEAPSDSTAPPASASKAVTPPEPAAVAPLMDRDFIVKNQVVERYLSGKLPVKGAADFERFCREQPELLDGIGLADRVNAGLRLLEASGKPEPWQQAPKKFWEKPQVILGLAVLVVALAAALAFVASASAAKTGSISKLEARLLEQPLEPASSTRSIRLLPSRQGGSNTPAIIIGGAQAQLADLRIDMTHSPYRAFRVTIDRIDQGRVAVLHNLMKDSNGHLHLALNSSALGPGNYQFTIEGLTWSGEPEPDAWITIGIQH
jgi:hypothetical protein